MMRLFVIRPAVGPIGIHRRVRGGRGDARALSKVVWVRRGAASTTSPVALTHPFCYPRRVVASQDLLPRSESGGGAYVGDQCGSTTGVGAGGGRAISRGDHFGKTAGSRSTT
jgi:hypothetical protein